MRVKYTQELLQEAVENCSSVMQVLDFLGLKKAGGTHANISRRIKEFGIDTSHFTGGAWNKGKAQIKQGYAHNLVLMPEGSSRKTRTTLHSAMQEAGIECVCSECGLAPIWNYKPLVLQIDHINGEWLDNRLENLRYLCPNCHTQTETYSRQKTFVYCNCGNTMDRRAKMCYDCRRKSEYGGTADTIG